VRVPAFDYTPGRPSSTQVPMRLIGLVLALGLTLAPLSAEAESDYGREKKWANEIVPGIGGCPGLC